MRSNRLQLNADKTEVLWCTTGRQQHQLPSGTLMIDGTAVSASSSVRDIGIHIDADLVMRTHVRKTVSRCFAVIRQLRQIRRSVPQPTFQSLVVTLVNLRHDYGNGALIGLPVYLTRCLQSFLNAAARLIFNLRHSDHVSNALISLHWLRVPERIGSKVTVLVYKVLRGCAPWYLDQFTYVADLPSRRGLRFSCSDCFVQPPVHRSTLGSRAFSVAGPRVWNYLPPEVTSAPSLTTFRTRLKTFLFTDIRLI